MSLGDGVPAWIRLRSRVQAVPRELAEFVLYDVCDGSAVCGGQSGCYMTSVRIQGKSVSTLVISDGYTAASYYGVGMPTMSLPPCVKRNISMIFTNADKICFGQTSVRPYLEQRFEYDTTQLVKPWVGVVPEFSKAKITQQHHIHLRVKDILDIADQIGGMRKLLVRACLRRLVTSRVAYEATVATILCYVLCANETFATMLVYSKYVWNGTNGVDALADRLKEVSACMKAAHSAKSESLTELFELNVLVNRGIGSVNWHGEKEHRTKVNVVDVDQGKLYAVVKKLFGDSKKSGYKYKRMHWDQYTSARWEWVPGGSVHSQYSMDEKLIVKGQYTRTKFVALNKATSMHIKSMIASEPQIRAWPSTKYEWGKQRAIYGTDLRSTVITNFAMFRCEDVLKHKFPVGEQAEASKVHKRLNLMLQGYDSFCFDYDDFNSQHSVQSMVTVGLAYYEVFKTHMTPEQREAMEWVIKSMTDMAIWQPEQGSWYKVKGTLLSGWRLTTFMNTVLNWAYMECAGVFKTRGVLDSVHNGDDVLISISTVGAACQTLRRMHTINARAQSAKCNILSISEFLRIEHGVLGSDGLGAQYLSRSCATLVHSRVESNEPMSIKRLVEADETRLRDLNARMRDDGQIKLIRRKLDIRASHVFSIDINSINEMKRLHRVVGGLNDYRWADLDKEVVEVSGGYKIPEEIGDLPSWPGIADYARKIYRMFRGTIPYDKVFAAVLSGSERTVAMGQRLSLTVVENKNEVKSMWERSMYRMYKGVATNYFVSMNRFLSIPPAVVSGSHQAKQYLNSVINANDKIRAMRILA